MMDRTRTVALDVPVRRRTGTGGRVDVGQAASDETAGPAGQDQSVAPARPAEFDAPAGQAEFDAVRMRVLGEFGILNTPAEQDFDDLTALAARLCDTPVALVSLLDADRLWFKSRWGTTDTDIDRDTSFCHHTLRSTAVLVVPDARQDERFRDSPLVTADGGFLFYAGAPLVMSDGVAVGALCVLDVVPREFGSQQCSDLAMIARQVVSQLELRRTSHQLQREAAGTAQAEADLEGNRHLLDEVLGHTDVVVYAKDLTGRVLMANPAMERSVGRGPGEVVGRTAAELFGAATAAEFDANDAIMLQSGSWQVFVEQLRQPDGSIRLFRSTKFPLTDAAGEVYAVAGVATDVTELTALRTEMLESERRFRALFDYSPVGLALSDEDGRWVQINAAGAAIMGATPAELVGRSALEFTHPDDHRLVAGAESEQGAVLGGVGEAEVRMARPDGTIRWVWLRLTPIPGPNGRQWTLGIAQDITARKAMEDELRQSQEELAAVAAVARCVQSGVDPRPVVVNHVRSLSGAAEVRLLEPVGGVLVQTASTGSWDGADQSEPGDAAASVHRSGRPVLRPGAGPGGGCTLWQPVVVEDEVIAVLQVSWPRQLADPADPAVTAVQILAGETGTSLHAAQLRSELERLAATDPLTGALNRRAWSERLDVLTERAESEGLALTIALIDLDNFKAYNDSHGHAAGDDLLCAFAADVRQQVGASGLFARWGGEEFILALVDAEPERTTELLERIGRAVPGTQTCSIGYTRRQPGEAVDTCIVRADVALYAAKAEGRDRVLAG